MKKRRRYNITSSKRSIDKSLIKMAKKAARILPAAEKYKNRKRLRPQERVAIKRLAKKAADAARIPFAFQLTESQFRSLKKAGEKKIIKGTKLIAVNGSPSKTKISVKDGKLKIFRNSRTWQHIRVTGKKNVAQAIAEIKELAEAGELTAHVALDFDVGHMNAVSSDHSIADMIGKYWSKYIPLKRKSKKKTGQFQSSLTGVAYFFEEPPKLLPKKKRKGVNRKGRSK